MVRTPVEACGVTAPARSTPFRFDWVIHRETRAAHELWKFCWSDGPGAHVAIVAYALEQAAAEGERVDSWGAGRAARALKLLLCGRRPNTDRDRTQSVARRPVPPEKRPLRVKLAYPDCVVLPGSRAPAGVGEQVRDRRLRRPLGDRIDRRSTG